MKVQNIVGSSKVSYKPKHFDSWIKFWESHAGCAIDRDTYYTCPGCGINHLGSQFDGCHVQKAFSMDGSWYIVPLCDSCNHKAGVLDVGDVELISVSQYNK